MKVKKPVTGSLVEVNGYYHTIINAYVDGKRKQISRTTGLPIKNNQRKAQKILEDRKREYDESGLTGMLTMEDRDRSQSMLLTDYMDKWVKVKKNSIAHATYESYSGMINGRIKRFFDPLGVTVSTVTPQLLEDFIEDLQDAGLRGSSQVRHYQVIKQCLDTAVRKDYILRNPMDKVDRPKKSKFYASFYNKDEALKMLEYSKDDSCYIPILLATFYGMRRSEVIGLQWSSIDLENNQIHINHKAYEQSIKGKNVVLITEEMKTESSRRSVPLIPFVKAELIKHREQQKEYKKAFRKQYSREWENCICVNPKGEIITPSYVTTHFKKFLDKHNLRIIRFHDLRHSCASLMVGQGMSMKQVQIWLGHSTFSTTADIYAHLDSHAMDEPAACIAELLSKPEKTAV